MMPATTRTLVRIFSGASGAALTMGGLSTLGDFVWATWVPSHRVLYGLAHGVILCLGFGAVVGVLARGKAGIARGAIGAALIGLVAAGSFYAIFPLLGWLAMFLAWMILWLLISLLHHALLRERGAVGAALLRGLVAAAFAGLAFWAISGIWLRPRPGGPDYLYNLAAWTFAFFPGFVALMAGRLRDGRSGAAVSATPERTKAR